MKTKSVPVETSVPSTKALETELSTLKKLSIPKITSVEERQDVEASLIRIKAYLKAIDGVFGESLASAKATVKAITTQVKRFAKPAEDLEVELRFALSVWLTAEQRKAETRAAKLVQRLEKKGDAVAAAAVTVARVTGDDISSRKVWFAVVEDPKLLPKEYWIIDTARLAAEARALKELFSVPGAKAEWRASAVV
jgi:hypothetical protein